MSVIISNGHGHFHLSNAAVASETAGMLDRFVTGAYPTAYVSAWLQPFSRLSKNPRLLRWLQRGVGGIPNYRVKTCNISEFFSQVAVRFPRFGVNGNSRVQFDAIALGTYRRCANRHVATSLAGIYHCRSGYGGISLKTARAKGMKVVIDHSIAYPEALCQLVACKGTYDRGKRIDLRPLWRMVEEDLDEADIVLVNSDFVKKTLVDYGFESNRVVVLYWGIDEQFESYLRGLRRNDPAPIRQVRFLFAGGFNRRKGADILLEAIQGIHNPNWDLTVAGGIDSELVDKVRNIRNPKVRFLGPVMRSELARLMLSHDVLVFPSLAEGSARVIFEGMAAGMAIITTPNAGSVVEDRRHGWIVPPGDAITVRNCMEMALEDRSLIASYGRNSVDLIQQEYHSSVYSERLIDLYQKLT